MPAIALNETLSYTPSTGYAYTLKYARLGQPHKPPLVFVHGTPWSSQLWAPFAAALAADYAVFLFDNPGYGMSVAHALVPSAGSDTCIANTNVSLAAQAEALATLLHALQLHRPPHIIAHDIGGIIALRAHLVHGAAFASLCLVDAVALTPSGSPFFRLVGEGLVRAYVRGAAFRPLAPAAEDMLVAPWLEPQPDSLAAAASLSFQPELGTRGGDGGGGGEVVMRGTQGQAGFIAQMVQACARDLEEVMPRYAAVGRAMPVKVVWGQQDAWISVDRAQRLGGALGAEEVIVVEDAGHLIQLDEPERLAVELAK